MFWLFFFLMYLSIIVIVCLVLKNCDVSTPGNDDDSWPETRSGYDLVA